MGDVNEVHAEPGAHEPHAPGRTLESRPSCLCGQESGKTTHIAQGQAGAGGGSLQPAAMQVRPSILTPSPLPRPPSQVTSMEPGSPAQERPPLAQATELGPQWPLPTSVHSRTLLSHPRTAQRAILCPQMRNRGSERHCGHPATPGPGMALTHHPPPSVSPASVPQALIWGATTGGSKEGWAQAPVPCSCAAPVPLGLGVAPRPQAQPQDGLKFGQVPRPLSVGDRGHVTPPGCQLPTSWTIPRIWTIPDPSA